MNTAGTLGCLVCRGTLAPYLTKDFGGAWDLGNVEYWRCSECGMVVSMTHREMRPARWLELNRRYHTSFFEDSAGDDPRRLVRLECQAATIAQLAEAGVLPRTRPWVDHGCGDGRLVEMLGERGLPVLKYDRFMPAQGRCLNDAELAATKYDLVISTSVFEHLRSDRAIEEIIGLVASTGVLALHTWVGETVPQDPNWFYWLPVHCVFYTNQAMRVLFERWGFRASLYHVESRMWLWFKRDVGPIDGYHYKEGFADYWK